MDDLVYFHGVDGLFIILIFAVAMRYGIATAFGTKFLPFLPFFIYGNECESMEYIKSIGHNYSRYHSVISSVINIAIHLPGHDNHP